MTASKRTRTSPASTPQETMGNWAFSWGQRRQANPWAWDGMAPIAKQTALAALASIDTAEVALVAWRRWIDASHSAVRAQQDIMLDAWRTQLKQAAGAPTDAEAASATSGILSPLLAAAKAYEQVGEAVLEAQRGAIDALSSTQRPH